VKWTPEDLGNAFLRLSSASDKAEAYYDDLVVWNRVLSASEIAALYGANAAVGVTCGLASP
jgi:hypothetical protein